MKCQISAWRWLDFYCTFWKPSPSHFEIWPNDFFELVLIFFITHTCWRAAAIPGSECWNIFVARIFLRVDIVTISVLITTVSTDTSHTHQNFMVDKLDIAMEPLHNSVCSHYTCDLESWYQICLENQKIKEIIKSFFFKT